MLSRKFEKGLKPLEIMTDNLYDALNFILKVRLSFEYP
jgi:hypothetical protein